MWSGYSDPLWGESMEIIDLNQHHSSSKRCNLGILTELRLGKKILFSKIITIIIIILDNNDILFDDNNYQILLLL